MYLRSEKTKWSVTMIDSNSKIEIRHVDALYPYLNKRYPKVAYCSKRAP